MDDCKDNSLTGFVNEIRSIINTARSNSNCERTAFAIKLVSISYADLASKYQLCLPTAEQLISEINEAKKMTLMRESEK